MTSSAGTEAEHIDRVSNYLFYSQTTGFGNVFDFDKGTSWAKMHTGSLPPFRFVQDARARVLRAA